MKSVWDMKSVWILAIVIVVVVVAALCVVAYGVCEAYSADEWCVSKCTDAGGERARSSAYTDGTDTCLCIMPDNTVRGYIRK